MPVELDELERRRIQLEIEREALRKEKDDASKARLEALEKELAEIAEEGGAMKQRWEAEKTAIQAIRATKSELEGLQVQIDQAEREANYERAAKLKYGTLRELHGAAHPGGGGAGRAAGARTPCSRKRSTADEIADIVAKWTGIPVTRLMEGETGEARPHGGAPARTGRRPGRGHRGRVRRGPAGPRRAQGPAPAHRLVPVPRARPASARPSWRGRSPSSCSTTSTP